MRLTMRILAIALLGLIAGCASAPENYASDRALRHEQYHEFASACERQGGYVFLERMGKATRRDEVLKVPGPGDRVSCVAY